MYNSRGSPSSSSCCDRCFTVIKEGYLRTATHRCRTDSFSLRDIDLWPTNHKHRDVTPAPSTPTVYRAMCRPPPPAAVQAVLRQALPSATVERVQGTPSLRLQRTFDLTLSDGRTLRLILSPHPTLRLLRFERSLLESEAIFLAWIRSANPPAPTTSQKDDSETNPPGPNPFANLPTLIHTTHGAIAPELASPCTFVLPPTTTTPKPTPLSLLTPAPPRHNIDKQTGALLRRLAHLKSPTGRFGPVAAVVPTDLPLERRSYLGVGGMVGGGGAETWTTAFHSLLEGILRDGEDMGVGLPYAGVRRQFRRLGWVLEGVGTARLVVLDGGDGGNVLVGGEGEAEVVGLADWSSCLFGDPLVAAVFSEGASEGFLEGFNGDGWKGGEGVMFRGDVVDDVKGASVRILLYRMYHALVSVVREFYRPRVDSTKRELEARKKLNVVLAKLGEVVDDPKRSHRRPSGDTSPAKRIKGDEDTHIPVEGHSSRS